MKIIEQHNNHLRQIKCDKCGSIIEYSSKDIKIHSQLEDMGFGDAILFSITCPNCDESIWINKIQKSQIFISNEVNPLPILPEEPIYLERWLI